MDVSQQDEKPVRLSICVPLYGGASATWVSGAIELIFSLLQDRKFELQVLTNHSGCPVSHARNRMLVQLRDQGMAGGWFPDYVLWLDSDNLVTKEGVCRLVEDGCDVVSALYFKRKEPFPPVMVPLPRAAGTALSGKYEKNQLQEVGLVGMGCCLMKWAVIEKMMAVHSHPFDFKATVRDGNPDYISEDFVFCERAREKGFRIFLDSRVVSGHIGSTVAEKDFESRNSRMP